MEKHCNNSQCLKKKYKTKFLINSILKNQIDRDNFRKKYNKKNTKKKRGKNFLETLQQSIVFCYESYNTFPHDLALFIIPCNCNYQQCFVRKTTLLSPHD